MKKSVKIWLITGVCLVLLGGISLCFAMPAEHWNSSSLKNSDYVKTTAYVTEDFRNISIDSYTEDIKFCLSDDGKCRVDFFEDKNERHTASVLDDTLVIARADGGEWYNDLIQFSIKTPTITVYLPQSEYGLLSVEGNTGNIILPKDFTFDGIEIEESTGDIDCRASCRGEIDIETDTGFIRIEDISAGELDLSVTTGMVNVRSVECRGNVSVNVSTGISTLENVACASIETEGSTGDIELKNVIAKETITIERSTGDVKLDGCDANELFIETQTGDVKGTLLTEKVFIVKSTTGRVDFPETIIGGKCKIISSTGDILISMK